MKRLITAIIFFSMLAGFSVRADSTIIMDGFEEYSTAVFSSTAGSVSVTSTNPRTGLYAFNSLGAGGNGALRPVEATGVVGSTVYSTPASRVCFRVATMPASRADLFSYYTSSPSNKFSIWITSTGQLEFYNRLWELVATSSDGLISTGQYYCLFSKIESSATANYEVRLNSDSGTVIASGVTDTLTSGMQTFRVGAASSTDSYDVNFDDIVVDSSAYPSVGGIEIMELDSNGSYQDWTGGTGAKDYTQIYQIPPTTATYVEMTTAAGTFATSTYGLESASSAGISGTINAIKLQAYARRSTIVGYGYYTMYDGSNWLSTTGASVSVNNIFRWKTSDVCPDGSACSTSDLDSMQIGAVAGDDSNNGSNRIVDIYLMVDFYPSGAPTVSSGYIIDY